MAESLRILILEDNPADAELVQFELQESGLIFNSKLVMTEKDFVRELHDFPPDLILSDYDLPQYSGASALAEAKRRCPDTPFILVTGAVTEDRAIEILTQGAKDYVLKTRLQQRLVPAVRRALAEAEEHRARTQAEAELREAHRTLEKQVKEKTSELQESRERLSLALTSSRMGAFEWDIVKNRRYFDDYVHLLLGTDPENFSGGTEEFFQVIHPDDRRIVQDALNKAIEQEGTPYETEYRAVWPDGSVHHIAARGKVQRDEAGSPIRILGVCWEITERRRTEERLRRQAELLNLSYEAVFMWELDSAIIYWNEGAERLYGYSSEEAVRYVSHDLLKTMHPQGVDHITAILTRNASWTGELLHITKHGRTVTVESRQHLIRDDSGRKIVLETTRDITARRQAEEALRESEERYRALFEHANDAIFVTDPTGSGRVLSTNPAACRMFGYSVDEFVGLDRQSHIDMSDPRLSEMLRRREAHGTAVAEINCRRKDGTLFPAEFATALFADRIGQRRSVAIIRDITERKNRENEQEKFNRTLRALSKSNQSMQRATDEYGYMEEVCKIIVEDCGHTMVWIGLAEEDEGKTVRPVAYSGFEEGYIDTLKITWADTERGRGPTGMAIRTGKPSTCRNMLTDPRFKPWREEAIKRGYASSIALPLMTDGKAFGALTIYAKEPDPFSEDEVNLLAELVNDLSYGIMAIRSREARAKAEEALRVSEQRFHAVVTHTPDHILMQDRDLRYQLVINPQLDLTEADMLGKTDYDILEQADAERLAAIKRKVLETGDPAPLTTSVQTLKGETEFFEGVYIPKFGPTGQTDGLIGYFRNITKRKVVEDRLVKQAAQLQERTVQLEETNRELESFSYSVSHDLKAPLRAIDGYSRMFLKNYGDKLSGDAARILNVIRSNTAKMVALIDDLLSFSRVLRNSMTLSEIDMDKLISEVWDDIRAAHQEQELEVKIAKLLPGFGDRILIKQVLFNLFSNAVKFTRNRKPGIVEMSCYIESGTVVYSLKDNGVGFDMAYYDKLFGVFQRLHSSEDYEGTGAGLAIVQRIINRHGGRVWAEGEVDKGAIFYFTLSPKEDRLISEKK